MRTYYVKLNICTGQLRFRPLEPTPAVSRDMSMHRCCVARAMLIRRIIFEAGQASVPTAADPSAVNLLDATDIGSRKVRIVCDQWVLGVYGDVDRTVGISLQNRLVNPVSNHKTTP